jgi:hypothetical protein
MATQKSESVQRDENLRNTYNELSGQILKINTILE